MSDTKNVYFYKAGDSFFPGVKIPVNLRRYRTIDSLLDDLNEKIPLTHGVRKLVTSHGRHHIRDVDQLENNNSYIVSDILNKRRRIPPAQIKSIEHLLRSPQDDVRWSSAPVHSEGQRKKRKKRRRRATSLPPINSAGPSDSTSNDNNTSASDATPSRKRRSRRSRMPKLDRSKSISGRSASTPPGHWRRESTRGHIDEELMPLNAKKLRHVQRRRLASGESKKDAASRRSSSENSRVSQASRLHDAAEKLSGPPRRIMQRMSSSEDQGVSSGSAASKRKPSNRSSNRNSVPQSDKQSRSPSPPEHESEIGDIRSEHGRSLNSREGTEDQGFGSHSGSATPRSGRSQPDSRRVSQVSQKSTASAASTQASQKSGNSDFDKADVKDNQPWFVDMSAPPKSTGDRDVRPDTGRRGFSA